MSFDEFLAEHRSSILGVYLMQARGDRKRLLDWPYRPSTLSEDDLAELVDELKEAMPADSLIADLLDWDLQLYDLMGDDWYFGAAFGPDSTVGAYADELAEIFKEKVEEWGMDYNRDADPDFFDAYVAEEAFKFIQDWRKGLYAKHSRTA
ncbi:MAG TPA: hypothetical protein P5163_00640 [Rubrivivax sp.]|nr:hypothetical protein [Rubrivivax sp.]